jgi:hypothetical protein
VRTVGFSTDGHGRAAPAGCPGLRCAAESGLCASAIALMAVGDERRRGRPDAGGRGDPLRNSPTVARPGSSRQHYLAALAALRAMTSAVVCA